MDSRYINMKQCVVHRNTVIEAFEKDLKIMKLVDRPFLNLRRFKKIYERICGKEVKARITIFRIYKLKNVFRVYYGFNLNIDPKFHLMSNGLIRENLLDSVYLFFESKDPLLELFDIVQKYDALPEVVLPIYLKVYVPKTHERSVQNAGTFQGMRDIASEVVLAHFAKYCTGSRKIIIPKLNIWIRRQIVARCEVQIKKFNIDHSKVQNLVIEKPKVPDFDKIPKDQLSEAISNFKKLNHEYRRSLDPRQEKLIKMKEKILLLNYGTREYRDLNNAIISLTKLLV